MVFYSYAVLNSYLYLNAFEGKLYATAGEWPAIPIPQDKSLFEQMANVGKEMAAIEKKNYQSEQSLAVFDSNLLRSETEIHSFSISDDTITISDAGGVEIKSKRIPKDVLHFESSGYEVVREWMKYHSYAYYRKACGKEEFEDLFNLIGRISDFVTQIHVSDKILKLIIEGDLLIPQ